jgi:allantoin racemase
MSEEPDSSDAKTGSGAGEVRVWHQCMSPLSDFVLYEALLQRHSSEVSPPGTVVEVHGVLAGTYAGRPPAQVGKYPYLKFMIQSQAIAACRQAEASGFHAVALATFADPYLRECRATVDIPVVSMPESCLFVCSSLAARAALVTLSPPSVRRVREVVEQHGVARRVSGVYPLSPPLTEHVLLELLDSGDLGPLNENLEQVARTAAADGAELLLPAEGVLNELLWSQEVKELAGLPVVDALGVTLAYTQLMVALKRSSGLSTSRVGTFAKPPETLLAAVEEAKAVQITRWE